MLKLSCWTGQCRCAAIWWTSMKQALHGLWGEVSRASLVSPPRLAELCDRLFCHSVIRSVLLSVSRITLTHERVNACQPNMVGMSKGWPAGSHCFLVLIQIQMWICDQFFPFLTLGDGHFIRYMINHHSTTLQWPWVLFLLFIFMAFLPWHCFSLAYLLLIPIMKLFCLQWLWC